MLNQLVLVGRLYSKNDNYYSISVPRSYKNENGEYENDIIDFIIDNSMKKNFKNCNVGDIIGIKGRLERNNLGIMVKAEKITFLSRKSEHNE